jgi:hypothetical protein
MSQVNVGESSNDATISSHRSWSDRLPSDRDSSRATVAGRSLEWHSQVRPGREKLTPLETKTSELSISSGRADEPTDSQQQLELSGLTQQLPARFARPLADTDADTSPTIDNITPIATKTIPMSR